MKRYRYCTTEEAIPTGNPMIPIPQPVYPFDDRGLVGTVWCLCATSVVQVGERDRRVVWTWMKAADEQPTSDLDRLVWCCSDCGETHPSLSETPPLNSSQVRDCPCGGVSVVMKLDGALGVWDAKGGKL